ncbi:carbohydrate ABC transporter permease [Cellulomonas cellasea]|uniref:ABC transporter permease n=2 Tax=Cellulomonas cellasea TaxID=43670 RepID=A0A0A0B5X0_9CELL|nr:sugar ABC transporter permease [Cellulomonas cellasea]KGM01547.1 ABC transporter permease [Cellulomonas cellasea DSM 20118]GEA89601.1 glycerol-3-phosphate ABC transporter permease [Cellulomonas cellasea]
MADIAVGRRQGVAARATTDTAARSATASTHQRDNRDGWLFLAPYLVLFTVFVLLPLGWGIWISLHDYDYTLPDKPFVGFDNYAGLLTGDSAFAATFWQAMRGTGIFTLASVPLLLVLPLLVALMMNLKFKGRNFFRAIYFAPYVLGVAVVAVLWRYLLDTNIGLVNQYLGAVGLDSTIPWLTQLPWGWISLVGVTVWWTIGFNAVIYLAALQDISPELYEAAKMDGASALQRFRNVTLPGLRPVLLFVTSVTIIASVNMFGQSFLMTQGGPGTETRTAIYQIADTGLTNFNSGMASAMSMIFTVFLAIVSILVFVLFREREAKRSTTTEGDA